MSDLGAQAPADFKSLEHLLRYCARPAFALERLSLLPGRNGRPDRIRYALPRHKRGQWVGPGRRRKAAAPEENGVVDLAPGEFLDRLADLIPPLRKHRRRYHGVFAPTHPLRPAVTALAIGNATARRAGCKSPRNPPPSASGTAPSGSIILSVDAKLPDNGQPSPGHCLRKCR